MITKVLPLTEAEQQTLRARITEITQLKKELAARKAQLQNWLDIRTGTTFATTQDRRWTPDYQYLVVNEREPVAPPVEKENSNEARNEN